jgi:KaiC/GvpD/RAD55 family RecA-like ATPase
MASVFGVSDDKPTQQASEFQEQQQIIQTGIPGFDDAIGQGLPSGNLYLITGSVGSSGNLLAQQILYNSIIRKSKVTYYTVENSSVDVIQDMKVFGMDIQHYVDDGSWVFARIIPSNLKKIIDVLPEYPMEQKIYLEGSFDSLMNHFYDMVKEGRNTALHLPSLIRNFKLEEIQNLLFYITGVVRKHGGVHFLLSTEGAHENTTNVTIKDIVDSVFEIRSEVRGTELENTVTITKIRQMVPRSRMIRLSIREGGLATETVRRVQ